MLAETRRTLLALRQAFTPTFVDLYFVVLFLALFARPAGLQSLLADGDTAWHIRTGQLVLDSGRVPCVDPFSFSRAGQPWFPWEWLADVAFALTFRCGGLAGVTAMAAVLISLASTVLFARQLRSGAGLWIAAAGSLAAASASSLHYLARPHIFSLLFYVCALWVIDRDLERPSRKLWLLTPLAALWANLHAAFVVLPATLLLVGVCAARGARRRYLAAAAGCAAATLLNPFGWRLHQHIVQYLGSSWILDHVQEFQSPSIRSEASVVFVFLLLLTVALVRFGNRYQAALVLIWAFAALRSARHIPFFAVVAAPILSRAAADQWRRFASRLPATAAARVFWDLSLSLGRRGLASLWMLFAVAGLAWFAAGREVRFPDSLFPVRAIDRSPEWLFGSPHILTSDQWADYLIFRLYPRQRVFFDGRSDFYGEEVGADYRKLMVAEAGWRRLMDRYGFSVALLPGDWALGAVLEGDPDWKLVYHDRVARIFARVCPLAPRLKATP